MRGAKNIELATYGLLKTKVIEKFGEKVDSYPKVKKIKQSIFEGTGNMLSESTIQRIFGLVPYNNIPLENTLSTLANYIGYKNWTDFTKSFDIDTSYGNKKNVLPDAFGNELLKLTLKNRNFDTFLDFIKLLPEQRIDRGRVVSFSEIVGTAIRYDVQARKKLLPQLLKLPQGRIHYYETFVDLDYLTGFYGEALELYKKYSPSKKLANDRVWANSMQLLMHLTNKNIKGVRQKGYEIYKDTVKDGHQICLENGLGEYPVARYHSYRLVYYKYSNQLKEEMVYKTIEFMEQQMTLCTPEQVAIFCYRLFSTLYYIDYLHLIPQLFEKYKSQILKSERYSDNYLPIFYYTKLAYIQQGDLSKAQFFIIPKARIHLLSSEATNARIEAMVDAAFKAKLLSEP